MTTIGIYEHVFPLIGGRRLSDNLRSGALVENEIYGTAFCIGGGFFLTAGHSIVGANSHDVVGLGIPENGVWRIVPIGSYEVLADWDIAVLKSDLPAARSFSWYADELPLLANAQTAGFPYALDLERMTIDVRAFRGHIASCISFFGLRAKPRIYELSFPCPRGLSGAPVFSVTFPPKVVGIIIGNKATKMMVLSEKEVLAEGETSVVERYEALQLGVALQSSSLLGVTSQQLSGTIESHLTTQNLLG